MYFKQTQIPKKYFVKTVLLQNILIFFLNQDQQETQKVEANKWDSVSVCFLDRSDIWKWGSVEQL